jgi:hypothetical protein
LARIAANIITTRRFVESPSSRAQGRDMAQPQSRATSINPTVHPGDRDPAGIGVSFRLGAPETAHA